MALNAKLSAEIRALRAQINADAPTAPTPTPPTDDPPPIPDTVDDAEAPATVPPPDDPDALDPGPFTGAPGTGFDGTASTARAQNNPKAGATMSKPALPEALSRDDSDAELEEIGRRCATHENYSRYVQHCMPVHSTNQVTGGLGLPVIGRTSNH